PGPIPNPEAKATCADGTALDRVWESRTPPEHPFTIGDPIPGPLSSFMGSSRPRDQHAFGGLPDAWLNSYQSRAMSRQQTSKGFTVSEHNDGPRPFRRGASDSGQRDAGNDRPSRRTGDSESGRGGFRRSGGDKDRGAGDRGGFRRGDSGGSDRGSDNRGGSGGGYRRDSGDRSGQRDDRGPGGFRRGGDSGRP